MRWPPTCYRPRRTKPARRETLSRWLRLKRRGVEDHAHGAVDAADALDRGDPFQPEQALGDRIVDVPAELLQRHVGRFDGDEQDRIAGDVDAADLRLQDAVGKVAADL